MAHLLYPVAVVSAGRGRSRIVLPRAAALRVLTEERIFRTCILAGLRPAGLHSENNLILTSGSIPHLRFFVFFEEQFYHLLTPKGGTKSVRQAKSSGNGRRMHLKRYSASSRPRFRRRIRRPFFFPFFRNAESVVRCAQLRLFVCVRTWQIYGLPECSAKIADEVTSSARAPGAGVQNSGVFCARSASAGVVTRYFSLCLIFWCFWIKPKAQEKNL